MIKGHVSARREAKIRLLVRGPNGQEQEIEAIIDTGFNGFLVLPLAQIAALALEQIGSSRAILADGSKKRLNTYAVTVMWDGQLLTLEANEADTAPLVGMALLDGYELCIQVKDGGNVTIRAL